MFLVNIAQNVPLLCKLNTDKMYNILEILYTEEFLQAYVRNKKTYVLKIREIIEKVYTNVGRQNIF